MEPRTPPKFVPTLTEVAAQEAASEDFSASVPAEEAQDASKNEASSAAVLRRRREVDALDAEAPPLSDIDIASLPTHSGWAQPVDTADTAADDADPARFVVDTAQADGAVAPNAEPVQGLVQGPGPDGRHPEAGADAIAGATAGALGEGAAAEAATHVEGATGSPTGNAAMEAATASLVASAAQTAQELEDAITRRVLRRVQDTLDDRLTAAVLKVVNQQTALLQSSLQLEIDTTIREAVADAVRQAMGAPKDLPK